jgi:hypothetical protein
MNLDFISRIPGFSSSGIRKSDDLQKDTSTPYPGFMSGRKKSPHKVQG